MPEQFDLLEDALKHTEMIVFWSNDPDTTRGTYGGQESAIWRVWLKEKGIKTVFIDPFFNYTAAAMDGTWLPPRPGSDTALAMAIAYVWITEGRYDKQYVAERTIGFDEFKQYILGLSDNGMAKTPEWAEKESGIPARKIRALAREWASKRTCLSSGCRGGEGGACRTAYGTEWARMMVALQGMQGLGKPGVSIWGTTMGAPADSEIWFPAYAEPQGQMGKSKVAKNKLSLQNKSTLCHEFCHHLDFQRFEFPDSWHTRGFYERTAALYHHARGTPPKRLFWVSVPGGRWRIDWPRTNRGV